MPVIMIAKFSDQGQNIHNAFFGGVGGGGVMFYSSFCATYSNIVIVLIIN